MEVRTAMTRNGGSMADPGSVSYLFNRKGVVIVPQQQEGRSVSEDDVLEATLDAGAEEVNDLGEAFEVVSEATDLVDVRTALQAAGLDYDSAEAQFVPSMNVELDRDAAGKVFRLVEALEDLDDVQNVFGNFDVSDEVMEAIDA
jgi:transcriptional/translational regulatory protein YebC/TACO1